MRHLPSAHWQPCTLAHCFASLDWNVHRVVHAPRTGFQSHSCGSALHWPSVVRCAHSVTHCPVTVFTSHPVPVVHRDRSDVYAASQPGSHAPVLVARHSVVALHTAADSPLHLGEHDFAVESQLQIVGDAAHVVEFRPVHCVWHLPSAHAHAAALAQSVLDASPLHLALHVPEFVSHWHAASLSQSVRALYLSVHFSVHFVPVIWHFASLRQSAVVRVSHDATHVPVLDEKRHCGSWLHSSAVAYRLMHRGLHVICPEPSAVSVHVHAASRPHALAVSRVEHAMRHCADAADHAHIDDASHAADVAIELHAAVHCAVLPFHMHRSSDTHCAAVG